MIVSIEGRLARKEPTYIVVECGGLGYEVIISLNTYSKIGSRENIKLHTYFMVKEDSQTLFGFFNHKEKDLFAQLIKISGVGGNTAMTILSSMTPTEFEQAIALEDVGLLKKIKGIGAKTAARIILELKGKLKTGDGSDVSDPAGSLGAKHQEAMQALITLGFSKAEVEKRIASILKEKGEDVSVEEIVKLALRK